ncbi:Retrotransposon, unclassified-like protein [Sesbania bispinosa]|nr:Retrotransposon, unclassified-like protein [Sesbania bispinosa]
MEMPTMFVSKGNGVPHAIVPTAILQSIMANQENLANLVSDLRTQVKGDEGVAKKDSGGKQAATPVTRHDDTPVTQAELCRLLQVERGIPNTLFEFEPPLTEEVLATPCPMGYQPPSFTKFDGTSSAREHLMCFLDDLGVHRDNKSLRLKEFSKSLAGRAFTWYAKLRPGSMRSREELATEFYGKFLEEEGITTFEELMRRGADVAEAIKRQGKQAKEADNAFDVCALEEKGRKRSFWGPHPSREYAHNNEEDLPPLPISRVQACKLVEEWLKDGKIQLKRNKTPLSKEQYDDPSYCILHKTLYHTTMNCWTIRRAFHRQLKAGKGPLPNHGVNAITVANNEIRIEEVKEESDDEEKLLSVGLAKTRGFRILFSQLGLDQEAQKEAARALTKIIKEKGGELCTANAPLTRLARSHATAILFKEPSPQGPEFFHNRPLYVEACVEGIKERLRPTTPAVKRFQGRSEGGVEKEYLPNGQQLRTPPQELQDAPKQGEEELEEVNVGEDAGGVSAEESKIEAIRAMRLPSSAKEIEQLLGKMGYIRRFIPSLGELISPLRELLKEKMSFVWLKTRQESFEQIKQRLRSQALADMLAISSRGSGEDMVDELNGEMPEVNVCQGVHSDDWWILQFDGTPGNSTGGAGVVLSNGKDALATIRSREARDAAEEIVIFRKDEGVRKMENLHHALCGDSGPSLYRRMQRVGMFWPTMKMHCDTVQRTCRKCLRMIIGERIPGEVVAEIMEEVRGKAEGELLKHHRRLTLAYEKLVRPRMFSEGELVLKATDAVMRKQHTSKWAPNWEGPYIVKEARDNGCCTLVDPENQREIGPINFKYVKKYYA